MTGAALGSCPLGGSVPDSLGSGAVIGETVPDSILVSTDQRIDGAFHPCQVYGHIVSMEAQTDWSAAESE